MLSKIEHSVFNVALDFAIDEVVFISNMTQNSHQYIQCTNGGNHCNDSGRDFRRSE